ncbi:MAG: Ig-like domain-containing protein, partial [Weeksellaceae bacterium]|nr:Ig-like domain-containing protein [Weeksellaceae bacterium]
KITNLSVNKAGYLYEGDVLTYTIGIKNDGGPSDTEAAMFRFVVPEGFVPTGVVYTFDDNSCGSEVVGEELSFDAATNSFVSHLNLPVDCEVTYTITVEITAATAPGNQQVQAGIMRPYDVYDPDATNTSDPQKPLYDPNDPVDITSYFYPPFDPFFEAEYNGLANSNNVDFLPANIVVVSSKDDINQVASGDSVKGNLLTNDSLVDEVIEVKFNGVSIPFNTETTLSSGGVTYGKITVQTDGTYVFEADPTFTGNVPPLTYLGENADSGINTEAHLYIEVLDEYIDDGSNNLPVAHLDTGTVKQEDTITINPLLNDFDIDNNTLSVTSIRYNGVSISSNPASPTTIFVNGVTAGTAYKDGYGNLVFEADKDFKGEIPFIYNVSDGRGGTASSTIIVNVIESDVIIDANDDAIAGLKGETVEVNILGNDTIEGTVDTVSLIVEDAAGNPVSVTAGPTDVYQNGVKIGSITLTVTGDVTFVPESNFVGSFNAPYTVCDTDANCSSSTVYFSILDGVRAKQDVCISGCNDNTFVKADDPNTIEYDNMIALFHSTLVKEVDGTIKVWGQGIGNNASGGMTNVLTPQPLNATNYPKLTGSILKIAGGSEGSGTNSAQFAVLTTDGLFIWGHQGYLVSTTIKNNSELDRVSIGTVGVANGSNPSYAKGLPEGVEPEDVKMLFGAYRTLVITTCEGKVWVLSYAGSKNGDGTTQSGSNNYVWHPVYKSTTTNGSTQGGLLEDVVATRGTSNALFALTSDGKLYTWGSGTYINNGAAANRTYATEVSVPFGITPKMIGMTQNSAAQSYYLLATDGRLYAMGNNGKRQLGIGNTTTSETWVQPQKPAAQGQGTGDLVNIAWISPNEHDYYNNANSGAAINVLTNDGKLWAWGSNSGRMIGGATNNGTYDPIYMPGSINGAYNQGKLNDADVLMAVETGGHVSIAIKQCSKKYGYVGHKTNGSMGDGTNGSGNEEEYNFTDTVELVVCGAATSPMTEEEIYICPSDTTDLNDAILSNTPSGYTVEWWTTADRQPGTEVATPENVGAGTYYSFYIPGTGVCDNPDGSIVNVIELQAGDPGYADCGACYKPGKFAGAGSLPTNVGITSLRLDNTDGWPQIREGAWLALEANSKGFVPNRLTTIEIQGIPAANLVVGMMVYNSTEDCLQINIDGTSTGWKCFSKQGCLE